MLHYLLLCNDVCLPSTELSVMESKWLLTGEPGFDVRYLLLSILPTGCRAHASVRGLLFAAGCRLNIHRQLKELFLH